MAVLLPFATPQSDLYCMVHIHCCTALATWGMCTFIRIWFLTPWQNLELSIQCLRKICVWKFGRNSCAIRLGGHHHKRFIYLACFSQYFEPDDDAWALISIVLFQSLICCLQDKAGTPALLCFCFYASH